MVTAFEEGYARLSPDGRWVAYVSNRSGAREIWVQAYPDAGAPTRVSVNGGGEPVWSRNSSELFYLEGDTMMAVSFDADTSFRVLGAGPLFTEPYDHDSAAGASVIFSTEPTYDVGPDGRFLMIQPEAGSDGQVQSTPINVVLNWFTELQRLVPTD